MKSDHLSKAGWRCAEHGGTDMPNCSFVEVTKKKKKVSCTRVAVGKGYIGEVESWLCEEHGGKETICGRGTSHVGDKFSFFYVEICESIYVSPILFHFRNVSIF